MPRPSVVIVSPAHAQANNGNWQTAARWQRMLHSRCDARITRRWQGEPDDVMLALHARHSADSILAWAEERRSRALAVVLTGTDLYPDLRADPLALAAAEAAPVLVVLQDRAPAALPPNLHERARVIYQSTAVRASGARPTGYLRAVVCGHLREIKSPQTVFEAARLLAHRGDIRIEHIGEALEPRWREAALATQHDAPAYRWLGPLAHEAALDAIAGAHLLVHPSAAEGGAHVIMEAVCAGTPVLASRVDGNVGMLGADYDGYFPHGDAAALAGLLQACRAAQQDPSGDLPARLGRQCSLRAPLFDPDRERAAVHQLVDELIAASLP